MNQDNFHFICLTKKQIDEMTQKLLHEKHVCNKAQKRDVQLRRYRNPQIGLLQKL
jgi:hypothetical protein